MTNELKGLLDECIEKYNSLDFIKKDPISIPHQFSKKQDIEISGFWTAMLSWGQRKTIINKSKELFQLMDNAPYDFITNHVETDRKRFLNFKHRTFQATDTLYFIEFFQNYYSNHHSLEEAFISGSDPTDMESRLNNFHKIFFGLADYPKRTKKHVSCPAKKSSCKRLNMFLRWMVRKDSKGVDFGLWTQIKMKDLMIPLDIHVGNVSRSLGLLKRQQNDWKSVVELTEVLRQYNSDDPVRYDYALFSLGINKKGIQASY